MHERKFIETLVERYLTNQATDDELEVFLELLRTGELDEVIKVHMDREADEQTPTESSPVNWLNDKRQWLKIAAQLALVSSDFWIWPA